MIVSSRSEVEAFRTAPERIEVVMKRLLKVLGAVVALGALAFAGLVAFVANTVECRCGPAHEWALNDLRAIAAAEDVFRERDKDNDGVLDYGTLSELVRAQLLNPDFLGRHHGYAYEVAPATRELVWWATATYEGRTPDMHSGKSCEPDPALPAKHVIVMNALGELGVAPLGVPVVDRATGSIDTRVVTPWPLARSR